MPKGSSSEYRNQHETRPRDSKVDEAKAYLLSDVLQPSSDAVLYGQQIETMYEEKFFHWITARALNELQKEGKVRSILLPLGAKTNIRFYAGFIPTAVKVRSYKDLRWEETNHDLDFVFERDGVAYGAEIKNTLPYIPSKELEIKATMCKYLGLRPLFIVRYAPKSYIEAVRQIGGFTLVFKYQLYPFGYRSLAAKVRSELGLPVDCPRGLEEGTAQRFLRWHLKNLPGPDT